MLVKKKRDEGSLEKLSKLNPNVRVSVLQLEQKNDMTECERIIKKGVLKESFLEAETRNDFYVDGKGTEFPISKNYSFPCMLVTGDVDKSEYIKLGFVALYVK